MTQYTTVSGSFRDPNGFLYLVEGELYRQVNSKYRLQYDHLLNSGLIADLLEDGLLVEHEEADLALAATSEAYRVLKPVKLPFVSYPFEWSFGQIKAAALLTLSILRRALDHNMVLKDASAYNVQFLGTRAVFIDTLSFELYKEGAPWVAYRQFCQHFLAPLALMRHLDVRLAQLYQTNIDGIPLDLANAMLTVSARLRPSIATHISLHARAQHRFSGKDAPWKKARPLRVSRLGFEGIVRNLESTIKGLHWQPQQSEWSDYYSDTNYSKAAMASKRRLVAEFLSTAGRQPLVIDLGSNTGEFSTIANQHADYVVAVDVDCATVEAHYRNLLSSNCDDILPLRIDLTVPSPGIGWANAERPAFQDRAADSTVIVLALVHHLAIANNVPLERVAGFLAGFAKLLIVEFIPKSDSQVQRLLASREDIFPRYTRECFEADFSRLFTILTSERIAECERTIYLMERRSLEPKAKHLHLRGDESLP